MAGLVCPGLRRAGRGKQGAVEGRTVLFVSHADPVQLQLAGACALAAAAMGDRVDVFVFGPAVAAVAEAHGDGDHPGSLLQRARGAGTCRLLACSAGLVEARREAALDPEEAAAAFDAVVGWPTVLAWSRGVVDRFSF